MAVTDKIANAVAGLNDRERKLLAVLGVVFIVLVIFIPVYALTSSISAMADENDEIADVLREISAARPRLAQREAEREASAARYRRAAPPLGSFLESQAEQQELTLREVSEQPEKVIGDFTRRVTRAEFQRVELRPAIKMLTSIVNSSYPIAVERLQIENYRGGENAYNFEVGIVTYERRAEEGQESDEDGESDSPRPSNRPGRAGPGAPE